MSVYANDNDDYGPPSVSPGQGRHFFVGGWAGRLASEVFSEYRTVNSRSGLYQFFSGKGSIFACPSNVEASGIIGGELSYRKNYNINSQVVGRMTSGTIFASSAINSWGAHGPVRLALVPKPSATFLLIEEWRNREICSASGDEKSTAGWEGVSNFEAHNSGTRNYLFVDGHVKSIGDDNDSSFYKIIDD